VLTDGGVVGSRYLVQTQGGVDRELAVLDVTGRQVLSTVTADPASRAVDSDELGLLARNYVLLGSHGVRVAGRSATVVSAISPSGFTAARWWVDDATGLLLWHETYDSTGRTTLSAGFTEVTIGDSDAATQSPARAGTGLTTTSLTVSGAGSLVADGWTCPDALAGLSLIRVRTDSATTPTVIHLGYTDGVSSVSVFEQRGSLGHTPAGTHWDTGLRAYVRGGAAKVASWQSGADVFTVVTDGSPELLAATVGALPHDPAPPRTTIERVRAGWSRILDSVSG
jgi:negative regulator of sigma E activity